MWLTGSGWGPNSELLTGDIDHPLDAISISQHTKGVTPKLLLEGHTDVAALGEFIKVILERRLVTALNTQVDVIPFHKGWAKVRICVAGH